MALQGEKTLEVQHRLHVALAGGITLECGAQVSFRLVDNARIGCIGFVGDLPQAHRPQLLVTELARQLVRQRIAEIVVAQDHRVDDRGETGLDLGDVLGLVPQGRPDRRRRTTVDQFKMLHHRALLCALTARPNAKCIWGTIQRDARVSHGQEF